MSLLKIHSPHTCMRYCESARECYTSGPGNLVFVLRLRFDFILIVDHKCFVIQTVEEGMVTKLKTKELASAIFTIYIYIFTVYISTLAA